MFFPIVLAASLVIALLRGGRISNLTRLHFRHLGFLFVPLLLQMIAFSPLGDTMIGGAPLAQYLYAISLALAGFAVFLNRHLPGAILIALGLFSNSLVILLNGGFMPVSNAAREFAGLTPLAARWLNIIPINESTRLPWLSDVLPLPAFLPFANVYSIGDVLVALGGVIFIQSIVPSPPDAKTNRDKPLDAA
jgi:hypothetical protein